MTATIYDIEVRPQIPERLLGLIDVSNNLHYSWDRDVRELFYRLDHVLWEKIDHNPKVFLRRVSQRILDNAAKNNLFMEQYSRVMSAFKSYQEKISHEDIEGYLNPKKDLVAYFCAEFGLHESFPIYSGGLGILAGDHCKAVSDLGVPFIAIGLLYRQGYFTQHIDGQGNQIANYPTTRFKDLPIIPVLDAGGEALILTVELPGREVKLRAWRAQAGHISMYLLDSRLPENSVADQEITFQLYGGDIVTRMQQEIVLGIGGVKLIRALGLKPTVWHINEGHAAFQIIERCRERVEAGMDFASALELVASGTVYTTHTPVPAGHDIFSRDLMEEYFTNYCPSLGLSFNDFVSLGYSHGNTDTFNMTAMALRGSRFHNGVSRIHGTIAAQMESYVWPQISPEDNPITYVTNGVHVPTFLAREWANLFDMRFGEWRNKLLDNDYWRCIEDIPDHSFWSLRRELKSQLFEHLCQLIKQRYLRNHGNDALVHRMTQYVSKSDSDVLVLGFARRFATYKRATLLFKDPERLARILNNSERPVVLVFAGKAHPKDEPGQDLIREIHRYSEQPEFIGKVIMLENYNMAIARRLVTGVDVWVNTPRYPLEASGTSGEKAAINGVVNLSVLDGWWGEGYNGTNGWGIVPHEQGVDIEQADCAEAKDLLDILENQVVPAYYNRGEQGYSKEWVALSKDSMVSCIPRFNASRMVMDYVKNLYAPARDQLQMMSRDEGAPAKVLASWKAKVRTQWQDVSISRLDDVPSFMDNGETLTLKVSANLNGLSPEDVVVECLLGSMDGTLGEFSTTERHALQHEGTQADGSQIFSLAFKPEDSGLRHYKICMQPYHELLSHPLELGRQVTL